MAGVRLIQFKSFVDERGALTLVEREQGAPPRHIFLIHNVPTGARRGGHAHKRSWQLLVALSGSCRVVLHDGVAQEIFILSRPDEGLFVPALHLIDLDQFENNASVLVMGAESYDRSELIGCQDWLLRR